ncbi:hypothetical protein Thein_1704 [Thermodesulfatator indicus DSM 15286]|uniref:DUF5658 domain-containing protein n=1 Tax=Thermodesulfatator indicus (strain DSM 15286 / JCM 11887 / CIR29812) TaxID=667014 RepID=F8ABA2_THEID|nr:DUF5658 family protein [Thermodesulfatator indicus]AEH45562.1 hypothetical protein Thein_1704 [Thermodesulfatator indicus DSM 15286]
MPFKKASILWEELKRPIELSFIFALALCAYVFLLMLSKIDAFLTLECLYEDRCLELNPLMNWSFKISPVFFLLLKSSLVGFFGGILFLLCIRQKSKKALLGLLLVTLIYLGVVFYHILATI